MNKEPKPSSTLYQIFIAILLVLLVVVYIRSCNKKVDTSREQTNFINSLSDSLKSSRLQNNSEKATISVLQTASKEAFLKLRIKEAEIVVLQSIVYEYKEKLKAGSSVTTAVTETSFKHEGSTVVTVHDTVKAENKVYLYPEYTDTVNNQWISYRATMNKDNTYLDLKITNRYAVILGYEKKKPFVDVVNYNPYSSTRILRSYQVSIPRQKVWGIGLSAGVGIGNGVKPTPYIGVGINYNIIRF